MKKAKLSDLKIGRNIIIIIGDRKKIKKSDIHTIRPRLTVSELKKHGIKWKPKEETEKEYKEYKDVLRYYVKNGFVYIKD